MVCVWGHPPAPEMTTVIVTMGPPPSPPCPTCFIFHLVLQACGQCSELSASQAILLCPSHALISHPTCPAHVDSSPPAPPRLTPKKMTLFSFTEKTQMRSSDWSSHLCNTRRPSTETKCGGQNSKLASRSPTPVHTHTCLVPRAVSMTGSTPVTAELASEGDYSGGPGITR